MAVRPVLQIGDPRLRRPAAPVAADEFGSAALMALIEDLRQTMLARDGAGLAAPQIGVAKRVVIFGITRNPRYPEAPPIPETVLVNPVLTPLDHGQDLAEEGCLSVPGLRAPVPRWRRLRYEGFDPWGQPLVSEVDGFHARVVQHECDHLDGILFPDRWRIPAPLPDDFADPIGVGLAEGALLSRRHDLLPEVMREDWRQAGLRPGMRVLVVGGDTGAACLDLARIVGPSGLVVVLLRSDATLDACADAEAVSGPGPAPLRFVRHRLRDEPLSRQSFDLVWCPGAALHLGDPDPLLRELAAAVRPGGRLLLHAILRWDCLALSTPLTPLARFAAALRSSIAAAGGDPEVARVLPARLRHHGLRIERLSPRLCAGDPGSPAAIWLEECVELLAGRLRRRGFWREQDRLALQAAIAAVRQQPALRWVGPLGLTLQALRPETG